MRFFQHFGEKKLRKTYIFSRFYQVFFSFHVNRMLLSSLQPNWTSICTSLTPFN